MSRLYGGLYSGLYGGRLYGAGCLGNPGPTPLGRHVTGLCVSAGGSFRHFLWQVCKELQSSSLSLLLLCPSSAVNKNKVRQGLAVSLWPCPLFHTHLWPRWDSFDAQLTEPENWASSLQLPSRLGTCAEVT